MDFKDFCNQTDGSKQQKVDKESLNKQASDTINKYANYSSDELMAELIRQTKIKQQDGSLSPEKIEQVYNSIYNILPPENRKKLDEIFNRIK